MQKLFHVLKGSAASLGSQRAFVLRPNTWDDFGSKSLYALEYRNAGSVYKIGDIKIISKHKETAKLEPSFDFLSDEFISLGQDLDFYKNAKTLIGQDAEAILAKLNDVALQNAKVDDFEHLTWYSNSLLRSNDAQRALTYGRKAFEGKPTPENSSFNYACSIPGADGPLALAFDFEKETLPYRIHAIIGRNGVGKTALLAKLAEDLATPKKESLEQRHERDEAFPGDRPLFSRVIAVSLSAFDEFRRPQASEYMSYVYCGVKDEENRVTKSRLKTRLAAYIERIRKSNRVDDWMDYLRQILGNDSSASLNGLRTTSTDDAFLDSIGMSSGQSTLVYCVSAIVAYAKPGTLVLFDEPELHLHPNALSQLIRILHKIMAKYDCYAILATHSALVLQEIPRKRVTLLKRDGNLTSSYPLGRETFGDDIAPLTEMVFETVNVENFYKEEFERWSETKTFEQVSKLFGNKLSENALAYLASLYDEPAKVQR